MKYLNILFSPKWDTTWITILMTLEPTGEEFKTLEPQDEIKIPIRSFPSYIILSKLNFVHLDFLIYKMGLMEQRI